MRLKMALRASEGQMLERRCASRSCSMLRVAALRAADLNPGNSLVSDEIAFSFERSGIPVSFCDPDTQGGTLHVTHEAEDAEVPWWTRCARSQGS